MNTSYVIAEFNPADEVRALDDLIDLLIDAVESGASVGFLASLVRTQAADYWHAQIAEMAAGTRVMLVAREQDKIVGSVQLKLAAQQNGAHRAEVQRLIVLRAAGRRGIGSALMRALETAAAKRGRTLLLLNTRTGDPPEALYRQLGYIACGTIPDFAQNPDGTFNTTTIMYRHLAQP